MGLHVLPFLLCNISGAVVFASGWLAGTHGRRVGLVSAGCALAFLLLKMVMSWEPVWEAAVFPWPAYIYLQGYWLYLIGLLFFGAAVPQLSVRWNRAVVCAVAASVFGAGIDATSWMIDPGIHGELKSADERHHYRQTTFYTCAPSACVSALSYAGIPSTEREMADLCLTHDTGTTVFNTYRGLSLKLVGTRWRCRVVNRSVEQLIVGGTIAVVTELPGYHAIALYGQGSGVEVQDPMLLAPAIWTPVQLHEHLDGTVVIVVEPDPRHP
jgi:hypothetical protein